MFSKMTQLGMTAISVVLLTISTVQATPVTWQGHQYDVLETGNITWDAARIAAQGLGVGWDLAAITSQEEQDFIESLVDARPPLHTYWLGGFQIEGALEPDGGWTWVTGEDFSLYENWGGPILGFPPEPNEAYPGEDYLTLDVRMNWGWNDLRFFGSGVFGLIAESLVIPALVDIKPGSDPNSVNLKSKGVLPVAIFGTDMFDVSDINVSTLMFGDPLLLDDGGMAASPLRSAYEDVSDDGLLDLTLKFSMRDLVDYNALGPDTTEGLLTGLLLDGTPFEGLDSIRIVPPKGSNGTNGAIENSLQASAIPEPSTFVLAIIGIIALIHWGRANRR